MESTNMNSLKFWKFLVEVLTNAELGQMVNNLINDDWDDDNQSYIEDYKY